MNTSQASADTTRSCYQKLTTTDVDFIAQAIDMSRMSNHKRIKIGCVITDGRSSVLGVGFNRAKSHPIQAKYNKLTGRLAPKEHIHAEIDAVNNLIDIPSTAIAYIGRLDCNGNQAMCKPCVACTKALKDAGVTVICYTNTEGKVVKHGL